MGAFRRSARLSLPGAPAVSIADNLRAGQPLEAGAVADRVPKRPVAAGALVVAGRQKKPPAEFEPAARSKLEWQAAAEVEGSAAHWVSNQSHETPYRMNSVFLCRRPGRSLPSNDRMTGMLS
jgi:hypothetical protein